MAGMFYTLQEVVEKLGKSEEQIRGLIKEGKLREYRDGSKLLFKVEEVDELAKNPDLMGSDSFIELMPDDSAAGEASDEFLSSLENTKVDEDSPEGEETVEQEQADETLGLNEEPEEQIVELTADDEAEEPADDTLGLAEDDQAEEQPMEMVTEEEPKQDTESDTLGLIEEEPEEIGMVSGPAEQEKPETADESIGLAETNTASSEDESEGVQLSAEDLDLEEDQGDSFFKHLGDTTEAGATVPATEEDEKAEDAPSESVVELEGLDLAEEGSKAGGDDLLADLTSADTNVGTRGVDVLEGEDDFEISEDTLGETKLGVADEEDSGLGDLDADLNLDSVGSGSGLLDLSLQADDTSLGAVLDDILPAEGAEGDAAMPEPDSASMSQEADKIFDEGSVAAPAGSGSGLGAAVPVEAQYGVPAATARVVETPPDAKSNAMGISLLVPIVLVVFGLIIVMAAVTGTVPTILTMVEGNLLYVVIGAAVVVGLIDLVGLAMDSSSGGGKKKAKKTKAAKPKKEKKAKKKKK